MHALVPAQLLFGVKPGTRNSRGAAPVLLSGPALRTLATMVCVGVGGGCMQDWRRVF
jgi:hypothetical protein